MRFWGVRLACLQLAHLVDVRQNTTTGDSGTDQEIKLLIATDRELQVTGSDTLHSQVLGGVSWDGLGYLVQSGARRHSPASSRTSAVRYSMIAAT